MSLRKYVAAASGETFEELDGGLVRATTADGKSGVFHIDGRWVSGELRQTNIHMLMFTGGPRIPQEFNYRWPEVPVDTARPSGWPEPLEKHLKAIGAL